MNIDCFRSTPIKPATTRFDLLTPKMKSTRPHLPSSRSATVASDVATEVALKHQATERFSGQALFSAARLFNPHM